MGLYRVPFRSPRGGLNRRGRRRSPLLVTAALAGLLLVGCSRTAIEQALAPAPELRDKGNAGEGNTGEGNIGNATPEPSSATGTAISPPTASPPASPLGESDDRPSSLSPGLIGPVNRPVEGRPVEGNPSAGDRPRNSQTSPTRNPAPASATDVPIALRSQVEDFLALGAIAGPFEANAAISRGEFARWLFATNNALHSDRPALQVRPGSATSTTVFRDVPTSHPDFEAIQGLAEAGILPSSLSGAQEQINFRPSDHLSREDLILWKVPLDVRRTLPPSNLEAVKEAWGFQDTSRISSPALRAVLADYSNGDQAVIRRVFGYTTLLQPQKPVTQAEAAAALWYFGSDGQGVSAADAPEERLGRGESPTPTGG